ncbi:uncharacterized protein H6S33_012697 [Morchella sextelata]|uniref:uncharacterized protein n=1 Tax=Morchella sextelata TaxID=1174677 RepID=UPI001D0494AC|nr:uncharacterized protein H6S33_012697 [Morchella sextelata]KAH0610151.1 hypothetical protein H6S33_012697 [Morchella sextelata]
MSAARDIANSVALSGARINLGTTPPDKDLTESKLLYLISISKQVKTPLWSAGKRQDRGNSLAYVTKASYSTA